MSWEGPRPYFLQQWSILWSLAFLTELKPAGEKAKGTKSLCVTRHDVADLHILYHMQRNTNQRPDKLGENLSPILSLSQTHQAEI